MHTKFERLLSKSLTTLEVMTYYLVVHTGPGGCPQEALGIGEDTAADCGLHLTHRASSVAWPGTQKKRKNADPALPRSPSGNKDNLIMNFISRAPFRVKHARCPCGNNDNLIMNFISRAPFRVKHARSPCANNDNLIMILFLERLSV